MSWLRSHRSNAWICGLTLLVPLIFYLNTLLGVWEMRNDYQSGIDDLTPRIARLQGLIGHEGQLQASASLASKEVVDLVYPASGDQATVSAQLQTSVRQILSEAGLTISNSQVLPVREQDDFDYISIRLTVEGDLSALDAALSDISKFRPLLLVESLEMRSLRSGRMAKGAQIITASLQLFSLRAIL